MTSTNMIEEMPLSDTQVGILSLAEDIRKQQESYKARCVYALLAQLADSGCRVTVLKPGYDGHDSIITRITRGADGKFIIAPNTRYDETDVTYIHSDPADDPIITITIN